MNTRRYIGLAGFAAVALLFASAGQVLAHGPESVLSERGYEQMRRLAHDLDGQAQHANDQAQHQNYRAYQGDRNFLRAVANFSRRAAQFHARMDTYRAQPWQVDDELNALLKDARGVQLRLQRSRRADEHTVDDWSATVSLLNRMVRLYQADIRGEAYRPGESPDAYSSRPRDEHGDPRTAPNQPGYAPYDERSGSGSGRSDRYPAERMDRSEDRFGDRRGDDEIGALAQDLADRSSRLAESARQLAGSFPVDERQRTAWQTISHFADQARAFNERAARGLDAGTLRGNVEHLVQDGREANELLGRSNVFPELRREWAAAMQVLQRLRAASGA